MRIGTAIDIRRPARRPIALLVGVLLLAVPAVVLASHQFPDVPTGHPFHDQISAIAKAGITAGFPDGGYHPSEPVTRQAMAAFMQRGFGRVGLVTGPPTTPSVSVAEGSSASLQLAPVREITITVPGASSDYTPNQLVHLHGRVIFHASMSNAANGCPCQFAAVITDQTNNFGSALFQSETFESTSTNAYYHSVDVEAVFAAQPGPRSFTLYAFLSNRESATNAASFVLDSTSSLSAMTFPFGSSGSNTP